MVIVAPLVLVIFTTIAVGIGLVNALSDTGPQSGSVGAEGVGVGVRVTVGVDDGVGVNVVVGVNVEVGVRVRVGVNVRDGVAVGARVLVLVGVRTGVSVCVAVGPWDGVQEGSTNTKLVFVGIMVGDGLLVGV